MTEQQTLEEKAKIVREEFKQAALPLIKYMAESHHPHMKAIVHCTGAEMLEGIVNSGEVMDFIQN